MKKVICSLLILLMLLSMLPMTVSAETPVEPNYVVTSSQYFTDVDSGKAYYTAANYLYEQGIMAGVSTPYASGKVAFGGERALTRAELVITLWRLDGSHEVTFYGQFPFSDCSYDQTVLSDRLFCLLIGVVIINCDDTLIQACIEGNLYPMSAVRFRVFNHNRQLLVYD